MPAWSPEIAYELVRIAAKDGRAFDQIRLQGLVYIAHGWCLALTGQPLTGDRPEAMEYGPEYRRLADALAEQGLDPVMIDEDHSESGKGRTILDATSFGRVELMPEEHDVLAQVYAQYGALHAAQLAVVTRGAGTPWAQVFRGGAGESCDIPHLLIREQFVQIAADIAQ